MGEKRALFTVVFLFRVARETKLPDLGRVLGERFCSRNTLEWLLQQRQKV